MTADINPPNYPTMAEIERAATDFDWEAVIELVTQALQDPNLTATEKYERLRARAKANDNISVNAAFLDIQHMLEIARALPDRFRIAQALNMLSWNRNLAADWEAARAAASESLGIARSLSNPRLQSRALNQLGWNKSERELPEEAETYYRQALKKAENGISPKDEVWALWQLGYAPSEGGDLAPNIDLISRALTLARRYGDGLGEAGTLRSLAFIKRDLAHTGTYLRQSLQVATAINDRHFIALLNNNFAWHYWWLGLYDQAIVHGQKAVAYLRNSGYWRMLYPSLDTLASAYHSAGKLRQAREMYLELAGSTSSGESSRHHYEAVAGLGRLAIADQKYEDGIGHLETAIDGWSGTDTLNNRAYALAWLSIAHLSEGNLEEALATSSAAVEMIDRQRNGSGDWPLHEIWWWRYQALARLEERAARQDPWPALERARLVLFELIDDSGDEGLRRNYLNKAPVNRAISETWAREAARQGLSLAPFVEREMSPAGLAQQLQRIVDSGARLAGERDTARLAEFIVQEFVELSGVERAVLAVRPGGDREARLEWTAVEGIKEAQRGTVAAFSKRYIEQAIVTRAPVLVDSAGEIPTDGLPELHLRSALALPLVSQGKLWGVLYGDMRHLFGRLNENDRDILSLLGNQAGAALENANWVDTLERQVTERTAEAENARHDAEAARAEAERANRAKSTFMSNMSHELRTPLNAIIGFTRIVQRKTSTQIDAKQSDNLDKVLSSSEHLLGLINTVLDIAKIEAGRMDVNPSTFSLSSLVQTCVALTQPLLKPGVQLISRLAPNLQPITTDHDKLKQILLNLLSNAAKFTHQGSITIDAHLVTLREAPALEIRVTDTGRGMPAEALQRIFEEFQQADGTTARDYGGTGLGLPISKHLAQLLGGDLTAASTLGQGSTFTLTLPSSPPG